jgi:hypothetical protein
VPRGDFFLPPTRGSPVQSQAVVAVHIHRRRNSEKGSSRHIIAGDRHPILEPGDAAAGRIKVRRGFGLGGSRSSSIFYLREWLFILLGIYTVGGTRMCLVAVHRARRAYRAMPRRDYGIQPLCICPLIDGYVPGERLAGINLPRAANSSGFSRTDLAIVSDPARHTSYGKNDRKHSNGIPIETNL